MSSFPIVAFKVASPAWRSETSPLHNLAFRDRCLQSSVQSHHLSTVWHLEPVVCSEAFRAIVHNLAFRAVIHSLAFRVVIISPQLGVQSHCSHSRIQSYRPQSGVQIHCSHSSVQSHRLHSGVQSHHSHSGIHSRHHRSHSSVQSHHLSTVKSPEPSFIFKSSKPLFTFKCSKLSSLQN